MRSEGMAEIADPSSLFITGAITPGCAVTCAMEGTRPMLVEVQALLSPSLPSTIPGACPQAWIITAWCCSWPC